ncbi:MAG: argininosuccinate lyase [Spirochaetaceae bacterium]|jgi:argininosuccinate lyase|nr:argininosuccinate lyase [Spirochaetaceae bacterium]
MAGQHRDALWQGRFQEGPDSGAISFETSIFDDMRLAAEDIAGSQAHVRMLGKAGIIPQNEADSIVRTLHEIAAQIANGQIKIDPTAEDIHSFIEGALTDRLGDTGRKVHTGRSRNDQIALDERLYLRRAIPVLQSRMVTLISTLATIAEKHTGTLLSGYTHLQRAQPVTLAHHLCAWAWMLTRDHGRLSDAIARISLSPLGAGALAGSSLPLDRETAARDLGFAGITPNSLDTVADRDYCVEIASALALVMTHLSRFCEEIVLWATAEFNFLDLSEKWSTGSSIMPQKKNPDFAELIRGRAGRVYGDLVALLTMLKGLPLAYNRDMQEDKASLFDAYDTVFSCLEVFTAMIATARWNVDRMAESCGGGFSNATDVAEYLARKGLPFRTAHAVSAGIVRECIEKKCAIEDLTLEDLRRHSPLVQGDIYSLIAPLACVEARNLPGGPAPDQTHRQIQALRDFCAATGHVEK